MAKDQKQEAPPSAPAQAPQAPTTFMGSQSGPFAPPPPAMPPPQPQPAQPAATLPGSAVALLESLPDHVRALVLKAASEAQQAIVTAAEKAVARALPSSDGVQYRPPLDIPFHLLGEVAVGNFIGRLPDGKEWRVAHATPLRGLPDAIVAAIRKVPGQSTGIIAPPPVKGLPRAA